MTLRKKNYLNIWIHADHSNLSVLNQLCWVDLADWSWTATVWVDPVWVELVDELDVAVELFEAGCVGLCPRWSGLVWMLWFLSVVEVELDSEVEAEV